MSNHYKLPTRRKQRQRTSERASFGIGLAVIGGLTVLAYATGNNNGFTTSKPDQGTRTAPQAPPVSIAPINDAGAAQ